MGRDAHARVCMWFQGKIMSDNVVSAVSMTRISGCPLLLVINLNDNQVVWCCIDHMSSWKCTNLFVERATSFDDGAITCSHREYLYIYTEQSVTVVGDVANSKQSCP